MTELAIQKVDAIKILAAHRGDAITVATMQAAAPWRDAGQSDDRDHIDASGCMGSASSIALGLAIGKPDRKVMILDGDGSLLMQLGSLVTIGGAGASNLVHIVFANGLYESSGNQAVPGQGVFDWCAMARACGYRSARQFDSAADLEAGIDGVLTEKGPVFIELKIARDDSKPRWPGVSMAGQVVKLRQSLGA